jgi:hypothetical protein
MVNDTTSRVVNMIILKNEFQYNLIRNESYVREIDLMNRESLVWSIKELISIKSIFNVGNKLELIEWSESFKRTRQWIIENRPELLI